MQCVAFPSPDPTGCTPASVVMVAPKQWEANVEEKKKGSRADGRSCGPGESNLDISTFEGDQLLLISPAVEQRPGREELVSRERGGQAALRRYLGWMGPGGGGGGGGGRCCFRGGRERK